MERTLHLLIDHEVRVDPKPIDRFTEPFGAQVWPKTIAVLRHSDSVDETVRALRNVCERLQAPVAAIQAIQEYDETNLTCELLIAITRSEVDIVSLALDSLILISSQSLEFFFHFPLISLLRT